MTGTGPATQPGAPQGAAQVTNSGDAARNRLRFDVRRVIRQGGFEQVDGAAVYGGQTVGKVKVKLEDSQAFGVLKDETTYELVEVGDRQ